MIIQKPTWKPVSLKRRLTKMIHSYGVFRIVNTSLRSYCPIRSQKQQQRNSLHYVDYQCILFYFKWNISQIKKVDNHNEFVFYFTSQIFVVSYSYGHVLCSKLEPPLISLYSAFIITAENIFEHLHPLNSRFNSPHLHHLKGHQQNVLYSSKSKPNAGKQWVIFRSTDSARGVELNKIFAHGTQ